MGIQLNTGSIRSPKKVQTNIDGQIKGIKKVQANIDGVIKNLLASGKQLAELNVGDKIKFGRYQVALETPQDIIWLIAAKNHVSVPAYPANSVTLITEKIIDLLAFDAAEPSSSNADRRSSGNNRYAVSNLDQWLNKDNVAGTWYVAAHGTDAPPNTSGSVLGFDTQYANKAGFLNLFTTSEKSAILSTTIRVAKPAIDGGGFEDIVRKMFLPAQKEVITSGIIPAEGALWQLFSNVNFATAYLTKQAFDNTRSNPKPISNILNQHNWWTRTAYDNSRSVINIFGGSGYYQSSAKGDLGVRPACNISSTILVSDQVDADGCYVIL